MKILKFQFRILVVLFLLMTVGRFSSAQTFSVGFESGAVFLDDNIDIRGNEVGPNSASSQSNYYKFGPVVEYEWSSRIALEGAVLYRRLGFDVNMYVIEAVQARTRANSWEFPILVKYYFNKSDKLSRPFLCGGSTIRKRSETVSTTVPTSPYFGGVSCCSGKTTIGITVGGGFHFGSGRIRFSPEVRYTRWNSGTFDEIGTRSFQSHSSPNQLDVLFNLKYVIFGKQTGK